MKAIVYTKYGLPSEVLRFEDVEKPIPKDNEVLVKVFASSINYGDNALIKGNPKVARFSSGIIRPKYKIPGVDIAGRVETVGSAVKRFKPGDEVYGDIYNSGFGAYAEYVAVSENELAHKPSNMSFKKAASVPQYGLVALQSLRDAGQVKQGQKVLINGASGGIGTFAVQIAKSFGADVTGVCSTKNLELVHSLGADNVIDYTVEDFTQKEQRYDLVLDIVANRSASDYKRALSPNGRYVAVAFNLIALLQGLVKRDKNVIQFSHEPNVDDLEYMKELIEAGKVVPVVAKIFPLRETAKALEFYERGNPPGKVVIDMEQESGED
jgi:NADPH:quinone reductase-like Zn-dependent oxidoreductase